MPRDREDAAQTMHARMRSLYLMEVSPMLSVAV